MKNRELKLQVPTTAELYALGHAAKAARAAEMARLLRAAFSGMKGGFHAENTVLEKGRSLAAAARSRAPHQRDRASRTLGTRARWRDRSLVASKSDVRASARRALTKHSGLPRRPSKSDASSSSSG